MRHLTNVTLAGCITALASAAAFAADTPAGKHLFILSGQSNMRQPLIGTFADTMKQALGEDKVIVSSFGQPSAPILCWYRKWTPPEGGKKTDSVPGTLYDKMMGFVRKATKDQQIATVTFVWMQGEADAEAGWSGRYEESFLGILDQLKADLGVDKIHFVLGRINDYWLPERKIVDGEAIRKLQVKIAEANPNGAWINTDDLNTGVNPWGTYEFDGGHFPNPGYRVMGQRFARKACALVAPDVKLDDALFVERYPDDAHKVKENVALGKTITGTKPDPSHAGGTAGLAGLLDGRLGKVDPTDAAWLAFSPSEANVEFIIDLGAPVTISSIAVNLLNHPGAAARFPNKIDALLSHDGNDYKHFLGGRSTAVSFDKRARQMNLQATFNPQATLIYFDSQPAPARYVKFEIPADAASPSWLFIDEIMINPVLK